jgi:hypothetical protein
LVTEKMECMACAVEAKQRAARGEKRWPLVDVCPVHGDTTKELVESMVWSIEEMAQFAKSEHVAGRGEMTTAHTLRVLAPMASLIAELAGRK